ncbi:hypothetical protein FN846DRAFT_607263 [Sphaerosporella brunnea]|uniref:Uncharacterized protein n=1 Tax=Sphaerosporella brunnea TaxID=1250544 RepID=A0A5J5F2G5_9PEZI|nr:hypothetical protein FN846DRAFT_607263 [Sphaerosporella brunnea]
MGNLCGKESSSHFTSPGRTLGAAPAQPPASARVPASAQSQRKPKISGQGKTLGSTSAGGNRGSAAITTTTAAASMDARTAAAQAAEARNANTRQASGKIGSQLNEQKRKTHNQHLAELSKSKAQPEQLVWD